MNIFTRALPAKKQVAIYFGGTIIRQLTGFIMLPIYTSYLTPADYGVVGLLVTTLTIIELLFGARFSQALPKFYFENKSKKYRQTLISTALISSILVSFVFYLSVKPFNQEISTLLYGSTKYASLIGIYLISLITVGIEAYGTTYLRIKEWPILFAASSIMKLLVQLSLNIYLIVFAGIGVYGIIISSVLSSAIFAFIYSVIIFYSTSIKFDFQIFKSLVKFSWPLWLAGLGALYISSVSRISINYFSSLTDLGLFELASKFAGILPLLIWGPFGQWWNTERFKIFNSDDKGGETFNTVFNRISFVFVLAAMGLSLFYEPAIRLMADPAYFTSTKAIVPLTYGVVLNSLLNFFLFSFLVTSKTICTTGIRYFSALIISVLLYWLVPIYGFVGASYSIFLTNVAAIFVGQFWSKKYFDNKIKLRYISAALPVSAVFIYLDQYASSLTESLVVHLILDTTFMLLGALSVFLIFKRFINLKQVLAFISSSIRSRMKLK
ncbi:lipopolysaccharide biosynthesis protein [Reinekea marinisedimentorum]|uniref:O-antigen/teichoic acid export membrane protein n=1 Tax=Reinekea marinisedimentorum TaxID=230495 RepID=A0A4R3I677_9GAMM|nr:oligosaccharide flippase family protein [Reinekea marinisedimentorum]TCS40293.1 O-antigen/teichoic acid export membrane protein [Reinekea marinisedimentorum]